MDRPKANTRGSTLTQQCTTSWDESSAKHLLTMLRKKQEGIRPPEIQQLDIDKQK